MYLKHKLFFRHNILIIKNLDSKSMNKKSIKILKNIYLTWKCNTCLFLTDYSHYKDKNMNILSKVMMIFSCIIILSETVSEIRFCLLSKVFITLSCYINIKKYVFTGILKCLMWKMLSYVTTKSIHNYICYQLMF